MRAQRRRIMPTIFLFLSIFKGISLQCGSNVISPRELKPPIKSFKRPQNFMISSSDIKSIKIQRLSLSTFEITAFKKRQQAEFGYAVYQKAKYELTKVLLKTPAEHFILGKGFPIEFQIYGKLIPKEDPKMDRLQRSKSVTKREVHRKYHRIHCLRRARRPRNQSLE